MKTLDLETNEWRMQAIRPHHHLYLLQENFSFKTIIEIIVFKEFESKVEWLDCSGTSIASSAKGSRLRLNQVFEVFQIFQWRPVEMNIQLIQIMVE